MGKKKPHEMRDSELSYFPSAKSSEDEEGSPAEDSYAEGADMEKNSRDTSEKNSDVEESTIVMISKKDMPVLKLLIAKILPDEMKNSKRAVQHFSCPTDLEEDGEDGNCGDSESGKKETSLSNVSQLNIIQMNKIPERLSKVISTQKKMMRTPSITWMMNLVRSQMLILNKSPSISLQTMQGVRQESLLCHCQLGQKPSKMKPWNSLGLHLTLTTR